MALAVFIPYGILLHFSNPFGVFIVLTSLKLLSIGIWRYGVFEFIFVKTLIPSSAHNFNTRYRIWIRADFVIYAYFIVSTYTYELSQPIVCSSLTSFSNFQYLFVFRRRCRYLMIGSSSSCFIDMNFVLSITTNLILSRVFLLKIWLIFSKVRSSRFVEYAMVETFLIDLHPAVAKKLFSISFSPLFSLSSSSFLVLVPAAKH